MRTRHEIAMFLNTYNWELARTVQYMQLVDLKALENDIEMAVDRSATSYLDSAELMKRLREVISDTERQFERDEAYNSLNNKPRADTALNDLATSDPPEEEYEQT